MVRIKASRNWDMMMTNKSFKLEELEKTRLRAMNTTTEIHSNSPIELQVYHLITCYHNFCIMSLLSRQQSFPLQVKRICRDSSFVTLMSFSAKLSLPARFFSHCFGSHGRTLKYFCNRLRTAKRYVTRLVSNHDRSNHYTYGQRHSNITRSDAQCVTLFHKARRSSIPQFLVRSGLKIRLTY